MNKTAEFDLQAAINDIEAASKDGLLTLSAVDNIKIWLTDSRYEDYAGSVADHIAKKMWKELDDVFWTVIPFGTGGRRGKMYEFGSNAINERTIGESAQGLADYVKEVKPEGPWAFAIAYDTRHRSREFAELCAGIMVANGFKVYFIDDYRSTPELSYLIRYKNCDCGIMVTASHNPPSDNAVKVYWSSGAQLIPPHDKSVIEKVAQVQKIEAANFEESVKSGQVELCREETDAALMKEHVQQSFDGPRDLKVIFSPLHGVGEFNVKSLLNEVGFNDLEIYERHREPSGDFPNVPGNVSNPENAAVFDEIITHAKTTGAELILASDPDCDRMGAAAPVTTDISGEWKTLTGNQLGAVLSEYILNQRKENGTLSNDHYTITTLVTTLMTKRITEAFGCKCYNENLVGFKWICSVMDEVGPDNFVFGTEESHGYLVGQYARDKDGAVACMLMTELAAWVKSTGKSLFEYLDDLFLKYGYHGEELVTIRMEGSDGMRRMKDLMAKFRAEPPEELGGIKVHSMRDYSSGQRIFPDGKTGLITGPTGNLVIFDTEIEGNYVAARPSGTEPKVKFYMFTYQAPDQIENLDQVKSDMEKRLKGFAAGLQAIADTV
jgi:phosphoglucomutase/phosphomannomutase